MDSDILESIIEEEVYTIPPVPVDTFVNLEFRDEWKNFPEFQLWLAPHEQDSTRAVCQACNKIFNADLKALRVHAVGKSHIKAVKTKFPNVVISETPTTFYNVITDKKGTYGLGVVNKKKENGSGNNLYAINNFLINNKLKDADSYVMVEIPGSCGKEDEAVEVLNPIPDVNEGSNVENIDFLKLSKIAPNWSAKAVVNGHIAELKLSDYRGRFLILFFYVQDFNAICRLEITNLYSRLPHFHKNNIEIVGCSVDSEFTHKAWCQMAFRDGGLNFTPFPLISDQSHKISRTYGCYSSEMGHCLRAHYIIDDSGILRHISVCDTDMVRDMDEILRLACAFQHSDANDANCSTDWRIEDASY